MAVRPDLLLLIPRASLPSACRAANADAFNSRLPATEQTPAAGVHCVTFMAAFEAVIDHGFF